MTRITTIAALICSMGSFAIGAPSQLQKQEALRKFKANHPQAMLVHSHEKIHKISDSRLATGNTVMKSANRAKADLAVMLGVDPEQFIDAAPAPGVPQAMPLGYQRDTDTYKFTSVYWLQSADGLPVYQGRLNALVRNVVDFPTVYMTADLQDVNGYRKPVDPQLDPELAQAVATNRLGQGATVSSLELVCFAGTAGRPMPPRTAMVAVAERGDPTKGMPQKYELVIDLSTGDVVHEMNLVFNAVSGTCMANVTQGSASDACEPVALEPMPWVKVHGDGGSVYTDEDGNFTLPNPGTVTIMPEGKWFRVSIPHPHNWAVSTEIADGEDNLIVLNEFDYDPTERYVANAYVALNKTRSWALDILPSYPNVDHHELQVSLVNNVCNAWYGGTNIGFGIVPPNTPGAECNSSAFSDIAYHEYGHHLHYNALAGSGSSSNYGEGAADTIAILISGSHIFGDGWMHTFAGLTDCTDGSRNADNTFQYDSSWNDSYGAHYAGQLLSGCIYDLVKALSHYPEGRGHRIASELFVNSMFLHGASNDITPSITLDLLTLDDDDGDLLNGTPHSAEILHAMGLHNMTLEIYPAGSCCFGESCETLDYNTCIEQGGAFRYGTDCSNYYDENRCVLTACCTEEGCIPAYGPAHCEMTIGGIWRGESLYGSVVSCEDEPCLDLEGGCCMDGACTQESMHSCVDNGGIFLGFGADCDTAECPEVLGACCLAGDWATCLQTGATACNLLDGVFVGNGSSCDDAACQESVGACCIDGTCQLTTAGECDAMTGTYLGADTTCDHCWWDSGPLGICCIPVYSEDGWLNHCVVMTADECEGSTGGNGGYEPWVFDDSTHDCQFASCPYPVIPLGGCCIEGICHSLTSDDCEAVSGSFLGEDNVCDEPYCGLTGACCFSASGDEACVMVEPEECRSRYLGVFHGPGSTCNAIYGCGSNTVVFEVFAEQDGDSSEASSEMLQALGQIREEFPGFAFVLNAMDGENLAPWQVDRANEYGVGTLPHVQINGRLSLAGSHGVEQNYDDLLDAVNQELSSNDQESMNVEVSITLASSDRSMALTQVSIRPGAGFQQRMLTVHCIALNKLTNIVVGAAEPVTIAAQPGVSQVIHGHLDIPADRATTLPFQFLCLIQDPVHEDLLIQAVEQDLVSPPEVQGGCCIDDHCEDGMTNWECATQGGTFYQDANCGEYDGMCVGILDFDSLEPDININGSPNLFVSELIEYGGFTWHDTMVYSGYTEPGEPAHSEAYETGSVSGDNAITPKWPDFDRIALRAPNGHYLEILEFFATPMWDSSIFRLTVSENGHYIADTEYRVEDNQEAESITPELPWEFLVNEVDIEIMQGPPIMIDNLVYRSVEIPGEAGACCIESECIVVPDVETCSIFIPDGEFLGEGTSCQDCQEDMYIGSCCLPDIGCVEDTTPPDCLSQGGTFMAGPLGCDWNLCRAELVEPLEVDFQKSVVIENLNAYWSASCILLSSEILSLQGQYPDQLTWLNWEAFEPLDCDSLASPPWIDFWTGFYGIPLDPPMTLFPTTIVDGSHIPTEWGHDAVESAFLNQVATTPLIDIQQTARLEGDRILLRIQLTAADDFEGSIPPIALKTTLSILEDANWSCDYEFPSTVLATSPISVPDLELAPGDQLNIYAGYMVNMDSSHLDSLQIASYVQVAGENMDYGELPILNSRQTPVSQNSCPADIDGDGTVAISDLLLVIDQWGNCDPPPNCDADITSPDGSPDDIVDIADLLEVIGTWGLCLDG